MTAVREPAGAGLRPPSVVMRLARLGSFHQTRLSFLRVLLRRAAAERWRFTRRAFDFDVRGVGTGLYEVDTGRRVYTLVAFGHDLAPERRTDRVIAEAWDATFALFDGRPSPDDVARLAVNVPRQEAGRYSERELVLARANRSVRLFETVVADLAAGRQPDPEALGATGYLMRTTAVYGNGKFGLADRDLYADRTELALPFQAEMLTVYLIRAFTADLVEHMAAKRAPDRAVRIEPTARRRIGVGNATGLGMAPFLVRHPTLVDHWITARETALARVRARPTASPDEITTFRRSLASAKRLVAAWKTDDAVQRPRIVTLAADLDRLDAFASDTVFQQSRPWDRLYLFAEETLGLEAQEMTVTLVIEPHGALIDDLASGMSADERAEHRIDGRQSVGDLLTLLRRNYEWALAIDFSAEKENALFWYVSEEKLEPRLGERATEEGADLEQPLAVARDARRLADALARVPADTRLGAFLMQAPEHRHVVRRVQRSVTRPYAEIHDNLLAAGMRPIDILRSKLSFFGATRFDPKSDKWLRITLFQGAPFPDELEGGDWDGWIWSGS